MTAVHCFYETVDKFQVYAENIISDQNTSIITPA